MSESKYIIIGDGAAGATAAENIRDRDDEAEIHVFTDETEPLYNRIMLKTYMKGSLPKQYTRLHDENWYEKRDIELHLDTRVENIDTENKQIEADGTYGYDKCLVATGGSPRKLPQDEGYDNLKYMWTMENAETVKESAEDAEKAAVIGGGLLGIDLAVAYAENDCETHYLIRGENWWSRGLDEEGAEIIHRKLEELGVNVVTNSALESFETEGDEITAVVDENGERYEVDAVAAAIGQKPNSGIIDVEKNESGMIETDEELRTSEKDVYAAGNMVEYVSPVFQRKIVNGAWDHSEAMGEFAGRKMTGEKGEFEFVNTYGVGHFNVQFLSIGATFGQSVSKKYSEDEYRRLFFEDDRLVGAVMIGKTDGQEELRKLIKEGSPVENKEELFE
ncbi:NAD(P)/FAD-dependent oxidoreductase [Candidatus Nanohalococcus occultus]|uniref:NAD(FAD)-dependent dehydrogenase n=1 Tax=Candidatus Nanohalococcus occultus TaxID=2978047 RepID=A0ABY8CEG0_9ARCH|nr:NAD(FAD)-dependent dehydrogenase [Candidatus Nanohaloarchaeota archaeon SVXNc]